MRLRWWLVGLVDRVPSVCWADLVELTLTIRPRRFWQLLPRVARGNDSCRTGAVRAGCCYCGKVCTPAIAARRRQAWSGPAVIVGTDHVEDPWGGG